MMRLLQNPMWETMWEKLGSLEAWKLGKADEPALLTLRRNGSAMSKAASWVLIDPQRHTTSSIYLSNYKCFSTVVRSHDKQ